MINNKNIIKHMIHQKWVLSFLVFHLSFFIYSQSQDQNYIKTTTYKKPTSQGTVDVTNPADAIVQVSYFDGLGRPIQQVAHKQSNSGKDIVTHIEYDAFGRQTKEYLPYVNQTPSLDYTNPATVVTDLSTFYSTYNGGTTHPYSEKELEASPLNRVFKQAAPGDAWAMGSGKEIKFDYQFNETSDAVKLFTATASWDGNANNKIYNSVINDLGTYAETQLYKTITKDENWTSGVNNTTEEFKDKEGRVVLKRTYNNGDKHDTYYVYDQFGNLTYVLPPAAEGVGTQTTLNNLGYQYKYDYRSRLVEKKLPGKQWEFIIYDKLDRPVATGPAFSPYGGTNIGWLITEYDVFGRVTQTGWKQMTVSATSRTTNQNSVTAGSNPFVLSANDILTKNYYDGYTYPNAPTVPTQIEGQDITTNVKGLPTGSWTKVLDANNVNAAELSYTLYDERYRPVRTYTSNHLGGYTQVDSKLDWAGKTEYTITTHKYDTNTNIITVKDIFEYTDQDRLSLHKQQIGSGDEQLIAKNTYDELGQLISKKVGGQDATGATGLQTVDYSYNIRGWLKNINDIEHIGTDLFSFKINYNDAETATDLYNGNISETFWKTNSDNKLRKYQFSYDNLNRLLDASYSRINETTAPNAYREQLDYDKNGNIQKLNRYGVIDDATYAIQIDELVYAYDPQNKNQLLAVEDKSQSPKGFKDGVNEGNDYEYDANGNLIADKNKEIETIIYNHLNLPTEINFASADKIEYLYNATGQKVTKIVTQTGIKTQTDYLAGGFQYKVNELQFFPHPEGYVNVIDDKYNYVFNYTDHLGNIRVSYGVDPSTSTLKLLEENHYYPFGLKHEGYNMDYKMYQKIQSGAIAIRLAAPLLPNYSYKYNGVELQTELGLNMYDMDMRDYDPAIARWVVQDPVVHFGKSPYNAFDNNPVFWSDPSGADSETDIFGRNRFDNNGIYIPAIDRGKSNQNIGIDEIAVESLKQTAKLYMDGEDMSNLNESQKQKIFKKDALKTIGILLWEFATGTGNESRTFEKGIHPFADDLISGRIIKEIITEFSEKAALDGYDFTMKGDSETYKIALEFSPNSSPSTWMNSLIKHIDSNAVQFFVGGAIATVGVKNNNLIIQIYNETSRNSLMLHIGGNYDRKNGNKSLSTIKQYINASYEISRN